ncbi:MAG: amylo-alpha-1,6-glucosidase, partial [Planctomycetota bacterium]
GLGAGAPYLAARRGTGSDAMSSVIAGYPWFSDWGRDTMISLPGLMLATGRHEEARRAITVFGRHRRRGLIPNRFDDYSGPAHYNTVDAPLWFLHAASEYRRVTGDEAGYLRDLAPACLDVIDAYVRGTDHRIQMDPADALVNAGDIHTQLTWMDAQRDGVTFTPRFGKAVEINALWHNGLLATASAVEAQFSGRAGELRSLADRVAASFTEKFVDAGTGGLFDRIEPQLAGDGVSIEGWKQVSEIRPNQVFAVSLPHSPLADRYREGVLDVIQEHLVTPHGLRTLAQHERGYHGRLEGSMFERDSAYHNGTVWPWLMGPFAEGVLRVGRFSDASRTRARGLLRPLVEALSGRFPGTIAEIYDGDHTPEAPQQPDGCIAQAWSVAETLRVLSLAIRGSDA